MNMQMPPPQIGAASRWRVWLVGGVVLAALVGGYWYFGQDSAPVRKRSTVIPVKVGLVERRDMAVVEHTLGTVVPFTIVQVAARVQGVIDSTILQRRPVRQSRRSSFCDRSAPLSGGL